jgi:hypothetical protein
MIFRTLTLNGTLFQEAFICTPVGTASSDNTSRPSSLDSQAELLLVHSPLLKESFLVLFPPLTYMLKFSGFSSLNSCVCRRILSTLQLYAKAKPDSTCCECPSAPQAYSAAFYAPTHEALQLAHNRLSLTSVQEVEL